MTDERKREVTEEELQAIKDAWFANAALDDAEAAQAYEDRVDVTAMRMATLANLGIVEVRKTLRWVLVLCAAAAIFSIWAALK